MRLRRLAVSDLRRFRETFELVDLDPGLNLVTGPNESGKSTLVRALQAAFFERHSTTSVTDLRPRDDPGAMPEVALEFEHGGRRYRLTKRFLKKTMCHLEIDGESLEGQAAEERLRDLLGFSFPGKGASQPRHWGIPGLLWIIQGEGQELEQPIRHAREFLRESLGEGFDELAASRGDSLIRSIGSERSELLTKKGNPRGDLQKLEKELAAAREERDGLRERVARYCQSVDRLEQLRREWRRQEETPPWEAAEKKRDQAIRRLDQVEQQQKALAGRQKELESARGERQAIQASLERRRQERDRLADLERNIADLDRCLESTGQTVARLETALEDTRRRLAQAEARRDQVQDARRYVELEERIRDLQTGLQQDEKNLARAREQQKELARLERQLAEGAVDPARVQALEEAETRLSHLRIREESVATRIRYRLLDDRELRLGEETLTGEGETTLIESARLELPGIGELAIEPGGQDLASVAADLRQVQREHEDRLRELGVASLAEARRRLEERKDAENALELARRRLGDLAPRGIESLAADLEGRQSRLANLRTERERLPEPPKDLPPEAEVRETCEHLQTELERFRSRLSEAREERSARHAERERAVGDYQELQARLEDPESRRQAEAAESRSQALEKGIQELETAIREQAAAIDAAQPDILRQDIERFGATAENERKRQQERRGEIDRLEGELGAEGVAGLEEDLAETEARAERLERRHASLDLRAQALDRLLTRLEARRSAMVEQLQAPLRRRVEHYLRLLFPEAELRIDESFEPTQLIREGTADVNFEALSFGAREQVGVILRLAYADALKEAGRPTLIVLDDALVHADEARRQAMQRVLFDAASRHQLLMFTCHPANWRELGVPERPLPAVSP